MEPEGFDPRIAHIRDRGHVFQVLNAEVMDWDEEATKAVYKSWLATQ
jgi:hypothetical protein